MVDADWRKIKAEYLRGKTSYRKLADKYGVSLSSITRKGKSEKWADLRKQTEDKATAKIVDSVASREAKNANVLYSTTETLLHKIAEQISNSEYLDPGEISSYSLALERAKKTLGIKDKPDLEEQQARIEKLRRDTQTDDTNNEIRVVIEGGDLEAYSK